MRKLNVLLLLFFLLWTTGCGLSIARADIPHVMNYQGKATDKQGAPLNGSYNLTFRIYNAPAGGIAKWTETQTNIPITNGIFQVQLGSVTPLNLPFDEAYWISLEINTDGEMSPRTKLASVPYAYKAESLSEKPVIPFYKKGFDVEYNDFNSIKISPGVMDVAGNMFTTTSYSDLLQLEYLEQPKNKDWVHGSKTLNSVSYIYAYNSIGRIVFKFSDEPPNLSDQYENTAQKPYEYRRYPDTNDGLYYRYIGRVLINYSGNLELMDSAVQGTPTGTIMAWAATTPPTGWVLCDGSAISRTTYADLFNAIGTIYGAGDGLNTFNVPDLRARVIVGVNISGTLGSGSTERTNKALANTAGEETHALTEAEMPRHSHTLDQRYSQFGSTPSIEMNGAKPTTASTSAVGGSLEHNNMQPYITLNYIIKT